MTRNPLTNTQLTGTMRGIILNGDLLISEGNTVERFTNGGTRITVGGWPKTLQTTGTNLISLSNGGFIHCSTGTGAVRAYDNAGTQTASAVSGIAGTTQVQACDVGPNGEVAVAYFGTTDTSVSIPMRV